MKNKILIKKIDDTISERSILKHPFYQMWRMGKLTRPMLKNYAKQYYQHVAAFGQYLSAVHYKMDNIEDRKLILENLMDEESGAMNHMILWSDFAKSLGVSRKELLKTKPTSKTLAFVKHFKSFTQSKSIAEGIATLYTYESQIPKVSKEKIIGLKKFYGVKTKAGLKYFTLHMKADILHSKAERNLIAKYSTDKKTQSKVLKAVSSTLDAYWNFLSSIQKSIAYSFSK